LLILEAGDPADISDFRVEGQLRQCIHAHEHRHVEEDFGDIGFVNEGPYLHVCDVGYLSNPAARIGPVAQLKRPGGPVPVIVARLENPVDRAPEHHGVECFAGALQFGKHLVFLDLLNFVIVVVHYGLLPELPL